MNKKVVAGLVIIGVVIAVYFAVQNGLFSNNERILEDTIVQDDEYSLSFNYFAGEDGYHLAELEAGGSVLQSYILVDQDSLATYQEGSADLAPPTMSVFIFALPVTEEVEGVDQPGRITRLQNWAADNQGLTSYDLAYGTPEIIELDGVKTLQYDTDGSYQQSVYLASYRGYVYMFVGQYNRPTDNIKKDFETLISSVRFD